MVTDSRFGPALKLMLLSIRQYAPNHSPVRDLAAFIGVCDWEANRTHPIADHYELICEAIPVMRRYSPDPRLQEKPGRKTNGARRPLPDYFKRAVERLRLNENYTGRNPYSAHATAQSSGDGGRRPVTRPVDAPAGGELQCRCIDGYHVGENCPVARLG